MDLTNCWNARLEATNQNFTNDLYLESKLSRDDFTSDWNRDIEDLLSKNSGKFVGGNAKKIKVQMPAHNKYSREQRYDKAGPKLSSKKRKFYPMISNTITWNPTAKINLLRNYLQSPSTSPKPKNEPRTFSPNQSVTSTFLPHFILLKPSNTKYRHTRINVQKGASTVNYTSLSTPNQYLKSKYAHLFEEGKGNMTYTYYDIKDGSTPLITIQLGNSRQSALKMLKSC
jgi:hypothetical protein